MVSRDDAPRIIREATHVAKFSPGACSDVRAHFPGNEFAGVVVKPVAGQFPPYAQVISSLSEMLAKPREAYPALNASYMSDACDAFRHLSKAFGVFGAKRGGNKVDHANPAILVASDGELDPVVFTSPQVPCALALVMPRREGSKAQNFGDAVSFVARMKAIPAAPKSERDIAAAE